MGFSGPWYHGTERLDRLLEKDKINPKRATSGPMPYFTDNPDVASNYASGKADTSRVAEDNGDVSNYFTAQPKDLGIGGRSPIPVERTWHFLPQGMRQTIAERAPRIGYQDPDTQDGPLVVHPDTGGSISSEDHYAYTLRQHRGNHLSALRDIWHDSGHLFGNEAELKKVYKLAGYPAPISDQNAPWTEAKGVLPAMLRMHNPLVTHNTEEIRARVIPHLEQTFKRDRTRSKPDNWGADQWDKNTRYTPREWTAQLKQDMEKGDNSFAWTSIPDKVTDALKGLGYDGVLDTGGKMDPNGMNQHRVAVPFHPEQVRSTLAAFDPASAETPQLGRKRGGAIVDHAMRVLRR